jgi:hypothetical protein
VSWDLDFVPPEALPDVAGWLEEMAEQQEDEARARRHGEAVAAAVPGIRLAGTQLVSEDEANPMLVDLYGTHATMMVAFWPGTTDATAPVVGQVAQALARAGSFAIYDPQTDEVLDPAAVADAFRMGHPPGTKVVARFTRPWYRRVGTPVTIAAIVALVLHKVGVV